MLPLQGCSWFGAAPFSCELRRRVLRHLILGHGLGVGSRIFDTGCDGGRLVGFLRELQLEAFGWEHLRSQRTLETERACADGRELDRLVDRLLDEGPYDAVVVRDLPLLDSSLTAEPSLTAAARMLACIRPGGALVYAGRIDTSSIVPHEHHTAGCYRLVLEKFPGRCEIVEFPDGLLHTDPLRWLAGRQGRSVLATLRLPLLPLAERQWLAAAAAAARVGDRGCCAAFGAAGDRSHAA